MSNNIHKNRHHGKRGRISVDSEWNAEREVPSRQVWVSLIHQGKVIGTSSGNLVADLGLVEVDSRRLPKSVSVYLTADEMSFVEHVMNEYEGRMS